MLNMEFYMRVLFGSDIVPLNINLLRFGALYCSSRWSSKNGVPLAKDTRLYFIMEGSGWLKTDTQTITLEPGHAYLIPSFLYHEYGCSGMKKMYFILNYRSRGRKDLLSAVDKICTAKFDPKDLEALLECYDKDDCFSAMELRMLLTKNILHILKENNISSPPTNPHSELINKAIAYIDANTNCALTVQNICEVLFVSESKLRAAFQSELGIGVGKYIDSKVMQKAKDLLTNSANSIGQISAELKFCDQFYFSRQYNNFFGMTPSAYRKSLKKK